MPPHRTSGWLCGALPADDPCRAAADAGSGRHLSAWIARSVLYRDDAAADPPNKTLAHLPRSGVIIWAVIANSSENGATPIQLDLSKAKHFPCCDGASLVNGEYELAGSGPARRYYVIVRIFFGSRPRIALPAEAQRALNQLKLPRPR